MYLASIMAMGLNQNNQNEEIEKRIGVLQHSLDFELLGSRSNIDFLEL
jgi:hypothetical protein